MARIGVQTSTVKSAFAQLGPYEALRRVAGLGYRSVELSQVPMTTENVGEIRRALDDHGVEVAALSAMLTAPPGLASDTLAADFDKIVADCRTLGTSMVRIGMLPLDALVTPGGVAGFAASATTYAERLAQEGIELYYHNHHVEFARLQGRSILDVIAEEAPALGLELDVHWVHRGGHDPVGTLRRYAGRARLVHLKDYRIGSLDPAALELLAAGDAAGFQSAFYGVVQFAEVGEGTLPWREIVDTALAGGAEHLLVEQDDTYGRDPFDSLAMSRDHLQELGYGHLF